ncbi:hypothetical protein BsWGS_23798 [Bradybaena similaris]
MYAVVLCTLGLLAAGAAADVCPYKVCSCAENVISCESLGLTSLPALVSSAPTVYVLLSFDTNNISTITEASFPEGLKEISFMYNPISVIDDYAFVGSSNTLQILSFSNAHFSSIPKAFSFLHALTDLSISQTYIQDWNVDAMKVLGSTVSNLDLEDVGLTTWPEWIQYFNTLTHLSIITSSIASIPDGSLHNQVNSLQYLTLINNNLKAVPKALSELKSVQMLNLMNTKISDLTYLPQQSKISSLALDNTSLSNHTHISDMLHPYASSLINIHLQGNRLQAIPSLAFLTQLGSIDLSHNLISDSESGSMPPIAYDIQLRYNHLSAIPRIMSSLYSLTSVDLSYNTIKVIRNSDFHTLMSIVDLSSNLISQLTDSSFPQNSSIMILTLNYNPIVTITDAAFQNLQQLSDLYLQNTMLTRLPPALATLGNLKLLDLSGSRHLVCTCSEKNLRSLFLKLYSIKGTCGLTTLSDFFTILSPSCPDH